MPTVVENEKKYDSNLLFLVYSSRSGGMFECHRFSEYNIDIDLEADTNAFDFVFKNVNGGYVSLFSIFDKVEIFLNDVPLIRGRIDEVQYSWDSGDSYIRVIGRCIGAALIDNDCLPTTMQNVKPNEYINERCAEYSIECKIDKQMELMKELSIGVGETEISIIDDMVRKNNFRHWMDYGTFNVGVWDNNGSVKYIFTSGVGGVANSIPIISLNYSEDGTSVFSESIIYGSTGDGGDKVMGTYKNDKMIKYSVKKRSVSTSYNNDDTETYKANAEDDVRYNFDNCRELTITVRTPKTGAIKPNTCAEVIDYVTRMHAVFFIKKVVYSKSVDKGSVVDITMVPSKRANDIVFDNQFSADGGLTGKGSMTIDEIMSSRKG